MFGVLHPQPVFDKELLFVHGSKDLPQLFVCSFRLVKAGDLYSGLVLVPALEDFFYVIGGTNVIFTLESC
jgi:hypothetical protein